jgi:HK97 family phage major capsid protein
MSQITPAMIELRDAINEAEALTLKPEMTKRDIARSNVLLAKIKNIQNAAPKEQTEWSEETRNWFKYIPERVQERADMFAGSQTITYTQGAVGGYLVPNEFQKEIILGMAQVDPLLDDKLVNFIHGKTGRPVTIPAWDLSTIAATLVPDGTQQTPGAVPNVSGVLLNGNTFKVSLAASFELEEDDFEPYLNQVKVAYAIAFARGIGIYLATGSGTNSQPQGILTGATSSGVSLSSGITADVSNTLNDLFQKAYFSVNEIYRKSPKCAWVMSDTTYQWIRSLTDKQARPLIEIRKDKEMLMGKPVLISPSMPTYNASPSVTGKIVFGDLDSYIVRDTPMTITRNLQAPGYVEAGLALYVGRMRVGAQVNDPTNGVTPPLVSINITA